MNVNQDFDRRLTDLKSELDEHSSIAADLGIDFERPVRSISDGYPENSVTLVGKIVERILKRIWRAQEILGDPDSKALNDLIKGCRPFISDPNTLNALSDVQRLRNRSAHDGYIIAEEDALIAVRRLLDVLDWSIRSDLIKIDAVSPRLRPLVAQKIAFLAGIYTTLGYKLVKRAELSPDTTYQLFCRQSGIRAEYVEILLTQSTRELAKIVEVSSNSSLLETKYPMLSRFLVLGETFEADTDTAFPIELYQVVEYEKFIDTIVDIQTHLQGALGQYPETKTPSRSLLVTGQCIETNNRTSEARLTNQQGALDILREKILSSSNTLVVGRPGTGKSTLLKTIASDATTAEFRRFRFFLDMSTKSGDESFSEFVARSLKSCVLAETNRIYDVFLYLVRAGAVVCLLDGIDEAVRHTNLDSFLELFNEISDVLSAESTVIMSSRYSFLTDSPSVRTLLNSGEIVSEKLTQDLHANGIDPSIFPRFSILRIEDLPDTFDGQGSAQTPLEHFLAVSSPSPMTSESELEDLASLIDKFVRREMTSELAVNHTRMREIHWRLTAYLGSEFLAGRTRFEYVDLARKVGFELFSDPFAERATFRLPSVFRPASTTSVLPLHSVFQEYFAAQVLLKASPEDRASLLNRETRLTEQLRAFLAASDDLDQIGDCTVPAGNYIVGPSSHLIPVQITSSIEFDKFPVTVGRYRAFIDEIAIKGCAKFDTPGCPRHETHEPWWDRYKLTKDQFYSGEFDDLPVTCISYWDAAAFAQYDGKRLATSSEWEAAARGPFARLFPWGDQLDLSLVNCADSWSGQTLVTYESWRLEIDNGNLAAGRPTAVDSHPGNISFFGIREMSGNTWELCAPTVERFPLAAVICGGSYDNPSKAVLASSKGLYVLNGRSNAVGFRCVREVEGADERCR